MNFTVFGKFTHVRVQDDGVVELEQLDYDRAICRRTTAPVN